MYIILLKTRLWDRGYIYKGTHSGYYSVTDEMFYTERQVHETILPHHRQLSDISPPKPTLVAIETGSPVEMVSEENYMFRLSHFRPAINSWLSDNNNQTVIRPLGYYNQVMRMLKDDIADISVSRPRSRQPWGIAVPQDPQQTIYVWLDALTNYLTVSGYPKTQQQHLPELFHLIGKDILKFHAIYWPAFLLAAGLELPKTIRVHGHWLVNNMKMSKSIGNVVDPVKLLQTYGCDGVRYFLLRDGELDDDSRFAEETLAMRYQAELGDQLGNLLSRCTSKALNPNSCLPAVEDIVTPFTEAEVQLMDGIDGLRDKVDPLFSNGEFNKGLSLIIAQLRQVNGYISHQEPWHLIKQTDQVKQMRARTVLYTCLESLRVIGLLLQPVMPQAMDRMLTKLGVSAERRLWQDAEVNRRPRVDRSVLPRQKLILFPKRSIDF